MSSSEIQKLHTSCSKLTKISLARLSNIPARGVIADSREDSKSRMTEEPYNPSFDPKGGANKCRM